MTIKQENLKCPFCNTSYTDKMLDVYNGSYGCETGCEFVRIIVKCEKCERKIYVKGEFGFLRDDKEKEYYISEVEAQEIEDAIKKKIED